jgi:cobalamin synthase
MIALATLATAVAAVVVSATVIGKPLGWTLPLAVAAGLATAVWLERRAVRRLGGITGDVLGAMAETTVTVTLMVAAMGPQALVQRAPRTGAWELSRITDSIADIKRQRFIIPPG